MGGLLLGLLIAFVGLIATGCLKSRRLRRVVRSIGGRPAPPSGDWLDKVLYPFAMVRDTGGLSFTADGLRARFELGETGEEESTSLPRIVFPLHLPPGFVCRGHVRGSPLQEAMHKPLFEPRALQRIELGAQAFDTVFAVRTTGEARAHEMLAPAVQQALLRFAERSAGPHAAFELGARGLVLERETTGTHEDIVDFWNECRQVHQAVLGALGRPVPHSER
jgi:hypothetical protein